jgi:hypothetical protein
MGESGSARTDAKSKLTFLLMSGFFRIVFAAVVAYAAVYLGPPGVFFALFVAFLNFRAATDDMARLKDDVRALRQHIDPSVEDAL